MNRPLPAPARDVALLLARLVLGTIMFAHGYQKLMIDGLGRTTQGFETMSIPVAIVSAAFVTVVEVVGGVLVVLGALIPVVAAFYLVVMVGAAVFVHIPHGIFVTNGGWELVGAIGGLLLALAAAGSGRYGVDHFVASRQAAGGPPVPPPPSPVPASPVPSVPSVPSSVPSSRTGSVPVTSGASSGRHERGTHATAFTERLPVQPDEDAPPLPVRIPKPRPRPDAARSDQRP